MCISCYLNCFYLLKMGCRIPCFICDFVVTVSPQDEELPDYIVVMVADKKTSQQISDDLALFLGNNTIKFTVWYV